MSTCHRHAVWIIHNLTRTDITRHGWCFYLAKSWTKDPATLNTSLLGHTIRKLHCKFHTADNSSWSPQNLIHDCTMQERHPFIHIKNYFLFTESLKNFEISDLCQRTVVPRMNEEVFQIERKKYLALNWRCSRK